MHFNTVKVHLPLLIKLKFKNLKYNIEDTYKNVFYTNLFRFLLLNNNAINPIKASIGKNHK